MITYWGTIGAGKADEFPPNVLGWKFGRNGGGGGSRVIIVFVTGFIGACCFRCVFGLGGRLLEINKNNSFKKKRSHFFCTLQMIVVKMMYQVNFV